MRGRSVVARQPHKLQVAGSNPVRATCALSPRRRNTAAALHDPSQELHIPGGRFFHADRSAAPPADSLKETSVGMRPPTPCRSAPVPPAALDQNVLRHLYT